MKKTSILILFLAVLFLAPITAQAFAVKTGDSIYIDKTETIENNLYAVAVNITIDGTINGDLICAAQSITINGEIKGDLICAAQSINVNGAIGGSVRAVAANSIAINSKITRNVQAFGSNITLNKEAEVGWDMLIACAISDLRGKINRDLHGVGASVIIGGEIGGNVALNLSGQARPKSNNLKDDPALILKESAIINGDLNYTSGSIGSIDEKAVIKGQVNYSLPKHPATVDKAVSNIWSGIFSIFSSLIVGLVLISLWREEILKIMDKMLKNTGPAIGWGAVLMFLTPIVALLLFITLIGIPLSIIILALWFIALYLSKIIVGILVGRGILEKLLPKKKQISYLGYDHRCDHRLDDHFSAANRLALLPNGYLVGTRRYVVIL